LVDLPQAETTTMMTMMKAVLLMRMAAKGAALG
jgi:hypothetical protein